MGLFVKRGKDHDASRRSATVSQAAAFRLSQYLRSLPTPGSSLTISSSQLARTVGVSDAQVRRDLAAVGQSGLRGVGYDADALRSAIRKTLGIHRPWHGVLVGVGNLARALLKYRGFPTNNFEIIALFDTDSTKIGSMVEGRTVLDFEELASRVKTLKAELGVITVPAEAAQAVADALIAAGVRGLLNFAPVILRTPSQISVVNVDLSMQFEQLAFQVSS
jgi:redox-sensing transcriptional repressor